MHVWQVIWLMARIDDAQRSCAGWWRVGLAIAAHESECGRSHLAQVHNNIHGIKAVGYQRKTGDGYRIFKNARESWSALGYLLQRSTNFRWARREVNRQLDGKTERQKDELYIKALCDPKAPKQYCNADDWREGVLYWHDKIWKLTEERGERVWEPSRYR